MLSRLLLNRLANPRTASNAGRALLTQAQRRGYMDRATYDAQVPDRVKAAVERSPPPTQEVGSGTCRIEADATRSSIQSEMAQYGVPQKPPTKSTLRWSDENAQRVKDGYPAVVDGRGTATKSSEWNGGDHHAVTVLSPTKDGKGFVAHDPDRTHDARTLAAHQQGRAEPRHNLRVMSQEELAAVRPRVIEGGMFEPPSIEPVVEQGTPSKSWLAGIFRQK